MTVLFLLSSHFLQGRAQSWAYRFSLIWDLVVPVGLHLVAGEHARRRDPRERGPGSVERGAVCSPGGHLGGL